MHRLFFKLIFIVCLLTASLTQAGSKIDYHLVVAQDGSGEYRTIQEAMDNVKSFPDKRIVIEIKNGVYQEKVTVFKWNNKVTFKGESVEKTIITFGDFFKKINRGRNSTFHTSTLKIDGDDFQGENFTVVNSAGPENGQAIALTVAANRAKFTNVRILGDQDSLYVTGDGNKMYFKNCYIEGTTDFIFGNATAVFEGCQLHSKKNSYITAASTFQHQPFGLVFLNCQLTAAEGINTVYLGRPWRPYGKVAFLNSKLGKHITPEGWKKWRQHKHNYATYVEYNNTGEGANTANRVKWSKTLSKRGAKKFTIEKILSKNRKDTWYK